MAHHQQRSFASLKNKIQASDVRRQVTISAASTVRSSSTSDFSDSTNTARVPHVPSAATSHIPLYDVADPVDFEECASQRRAGSTTFGCLSTGSSPRRFQEFPADDIEVKVVQRDPQTIESPIPADIDIKGLDWHTRDVLTAYNNALVLVHRRYEQYSTGDAYTKQCSERMILGIIHKLRNTCSQPSKRASYASHNSSDSASTGGESTSTARESSCSVPNLQHSVGDPTLPGVTQRISPERLFLSNEARRQSQRQQALMSLFPLQHEDEVIERRTPPPFPMEHSGNRLLIKILELNLEPEFEPIFASMALYEAKERKKVSENFYFDLNSDNLKAMLRTHISYQDVSSLSRSAIYNVTYPTQDMFLVVKLEKVLQACDITEAVDPYVKEDKNRDKLRSAAYEYCERLGGYRMPLAWTMIDLSKVFTGANSLEKVESSSVCPTPSTLTGTESICGTSDTDSIISMDRQSYLSTGSFRRVGSGRKLTAARPPSGGAISEANLVGFRPVTLTVNTFFKQESEKLSDEDLYKHLSEAKKASALNKKLKCIPGFLKLEIAPCPEDLNNRLNPELLRLHPFVTGERTEATKEILEFPLREVFAPNCLYRTPQFYDEIKVKLPIDLSDAHHLLFTFYHVSCRTKPSESASVETPVGYSWIPLYRDKRLVTGDFSIPISLEPLPQSYFYLSPEVNLPNIKWLDGHKPAFSVSLAVTSTIHTQDVHLDNFLRLYHTTRSNDRCVTEFELQTSIQNLTKGLSINFVTPVVLGVNVGQTCFEMLGQLVKILTFLMDGYCDQHGRSSLLSSYIHYHRITSHGNEQYLPKAESSASVGKSKSVDTATDSMRRTASQPQVSPRRSPPDTNRELLDIIKGIIP